MPRPRLSTRARIGDRYSSPRQLRSGRIRARDLGPSRGLWRKNRLDAHRPHGRRVRGCGSAGCSAATNSTRRALGEGFEDSRSDMVTARHRGARRMPSSLGAVSRRRPCRLPAGRSFARFRQNRKAGGRDRPPLYHQEWMTRDIADALVRHGGARGATCVIEAEQLCLLLGEDRRGDERVITQAWAGEFESSHQARNRISPQALRLRPRPAATGINRLQIRLAGQLLVPLDRLGSRPISSTTYTMQLPATRNSPPQSSPPAGRLRNDRPDRDQAVASDASQKPRFRLPAVPQAVPCRRPSNNAIR